VTNLRGWSASACLTDAKHHLEPVPASVAPQRSVITLILRKAVPSQAGTESTCSKGA